ncbi:hypothetical protein TNCV_1408831 [Trichonephila clavipes]|uniref:Uncharacterized protein n=1 Tax=Trichonephila clavipes TaxID=2585209 RepID=A0A8X6RA92_TRICX|nr:hypothetical protein TNCV_1408831 [Trichonephila clavipes]
MPLWRPLGRRMEFRCGSEQERAEALIKSTVQWMPQCSKFDDRGATRPYPISDSGRAPHWSSSIGSRLTICPTARTRLSAISMYVVT